MTIEQDLKTVREALEAMRGGGVWPINGVTATRGLTALDRIEARTLPDLPDGWIINTMHFYRRKGEWSAAIDNVITLDVAQGEGKTPREAILNAIGKI